MDLNHSPSRRCASPVKKFMMHFSQYAHAYCFLQLSSLVSYYLNKCFTSPKTGAFVLELCIGKSKSREKYKSRKKSDKIGKIGFDFLSDFLAKMPKCHKMP